MKIDQDVKRLRAAGSPQGDCRRLDGRPKRRYPSEHATRAAIEDEYRHQDRKGIPRQAAEAYVCPSCGWWHWGKAKRPKPESRRVGWYQPGYAAARNDLAFEVEVGCRVWGCAADENGGDRRKRHRMLVKRGRRAATGRDANPEHNRNRQRPFPCVLVPYADEENPTP